MSEQGWTAERIAELREDCHARTDVYLGDYVVKSSTFLSLLDELERAREQRDEAMNLVRTYNEAATGMLADVRATREAIASKRAPLRETLELPPVLP